MPYEVVLLGQASEFLSTLENKLKAKAFRTIDLLQYFGPQLPLPHSKKLHGYDLWELRVRQGNTICRLFYFQKKNSSFILTSGYIKKSDKTDPIQIEKALRLKKEYLRGTRL